MDDTLTLQLAIAHPEFVTSDIFWQDRRITFRPLQSDDAAKLARYFASLSTGTRQMFGPHPFTPEQAQSLCADIADDDMLRMVAVLGEAPDDSIIAYFILNFELAEDDRQRYDRYGAHLEAPVCRFGPSVSDSLRGYGLGSALFEELVAIAHRFGCTCVMLLGGVYVDNERAIRFYEKVGLQKQGVYTSPNGRQSYDMALWLG